MNTIPGSAGKPLCPESLDGAWSKVETLSARPERRADYEAENKVLSELATRMIESPHTILQCLSDAALNLTGAHSAGVSVMENERETPELHWLATSGGFSEHVGLTVVGSKPLRCGVRTNAMLLITDPVQTDPEIEKLCDATCELASTGGEPACELLLAPFHRNGIPVGTVWAVSHKRDKKFDGEDARLLGSVARFASAATQVVSQLDTMESVNQRLVTEADQRQRAESRVLATLAHELRNPLAAMANAFALLERDGTGERRQKAREIMQRQLTHMRHLLDGLLNDSRTQQGHAEPVRERVAMRSVVRNAVEMSAAEADARGHELCMTLPNEELHVLGDATHLAQIVCNLLTNAAKYTQGSGRIVLTLAREAEDAVVRVVDSGIGIAPEMLYKVFEMFFQVDHQSVGKDSGLGIGLAVVARLVGQHGGTVVASSQGLGRGSTFTVRIPLAL